MQAKMCRENKQHLFHIETEKVSTLPYLDQGHGAQQCPVEESLSLCNFFRPHKAGDKTVAVGGSKGRVPGSQVHTHTPKHFISITNHSVRNMNALMHRDLVQIQGKRMLFIAEQQKLS